MSPFSLVFYGKCQYMLLKSQCGVCRSTCAIAQIFQTYHWTNNFSGGHCGLWGSYASSNQPILSSTECKAFSFALHLKSHNHLYPKEIWAFNSFEAKPHNKNFFYVTFFISGLHKALWFMELLVGWEKSWSWPPAKYSPVVLVAWDHRSNLEKPSSDLFWKEENYGIQLSGWLSEHTARSVSAQNKLRLIQELLVLPAVKCLAIFRHAFHRGKKAFSTVSSLSLKDLCKQNSLSLTERLKAVIETHC